MITQAKRLVAGTLLIATGTLTSVLTTIKPADAQLIGGGGTCAPHPVTYQQYVPGYYNKNGVWVNSHYETLSRMSTECNTSAPEAAKIQPGQWYTDANNRGTTYVAKTGANAYRFTNEQGRVTTGSATGKRVTTANWSVTGVVENDGSRIAWSNGTTWTRYPQ